MLNNTFNKNAKLGDMDNLYHLYLGKAGSHAYGTNTPTSDDDFRGIFVASREFLTTPYYHRGEYSDPKQKDHKSYEIAKFIKLYTDGNPNIVELLWIDESDILHSTPQYELLRKHRYDLLSSKLAFSFTGYALSQLKAMKNQSKWENNPQSVTPPRQIDYVNMVVNFTIDKLFRINLEDYYNHHRLVHYGGNVYGLYNETGYSPFNENTFSLNVNAEEFEHTTPNGERKTPKFIVKFNIDEYKRDLDVWTKYWEWRNLKNKKITLYTLLEHELLARSSNSVHEDNLVDECSIETVVEQDDMSSFIQTLKSNVLVELVHTCKRHFDFKQNSVDCYSTDTQFLTENGWKYYDEILDDELLSTFNTETFKHEYQPIIERYSNLYTGNMYHFNGLYQDSLVTANHRMFVSKQERKTGKKYDWEFVNACKSYDYFEVLHHLEPKSNRQNIPSTLDTKVFDHVDMHNYLRVIGWYCSEGSSVIENDRLKCVCISQSKPDSRLTQNMERLRNSGKIKCTHKLEDKGEGRYPENIYTFRGYLAQNLVDVCGRLSKYVHLPKFVFELTGREQNILLTALLQGDGTKKPDGSYTYYTTSPQLADDVQRLCVCAGHSSHITGPYHYGNPLHEPVYHVHLWKHPEKTKRVQRNINVTKEYVTDKRVVCFEVKNGTLITRRNGKVSYHGNCKNGMHLVRLMKMGVEILRDGDVNVKRPDAAELLAIRNGSWSYDELVAFGEEQERVIREVYYPQTKLPKKANIQLASKLLLQIQDEVWFK